MVIKTIKKRNDAEVDFDLNKITQAVYKALSATQEGTEADAEKISKKVLKELEKISQHTRNYLPDVESIQDSVENVLIAAGYTKTAKAYILYRQKHTEARQKAPLDNEKLKELIQKSKSYFHNPLSYLIYLRTYARWINAEKRRETWMETVDRYMNFMRDNLGNKLSQKEYSEIHQAILEQEIMPSMRLMQFAGTATASSHVFAYNCSYIAPKQLEDFGEVMYVSMCGCGVGFSVETQNIQTLPIIKKQNNQKLINHVIEDSKEGWCKAFVLGMHTWFSGDDIKFDYSKLRPLGARLKTTGGKSSGPEPLRELLEFTRAKILQRQGRRLTNLNAHDILCKIGEVVVSGGVRRSAMISLSDIDDQEMRNAKNGPFYYKYPQRSYANNSAVYEDRPSQEVLMEEWLALVKSGTGERGFFNRGSILNTLPARRKEYFAQKKLINNDTITGFLGTNPCGEIILQSKQFCNLTEIVARPTDDETSLLRKTRLAAIVGTYQATLTHFPFLSKEWQRNCEEERLLGISITGQWDCPSVRQSSVQENLKKVALETNKRYAAHLGINAATAVTCVKPSGTVSLVVDSSSGMHPRFAHYYIRRVRISATDALFKMLKEQGVPYNPEVGYAAENSPNYVFDFPVAAPKGSIVRNHLTAFDQLEYWKLVKLHFTEHNPSVTISVGKEEWIGVLNWLINQWEIIGGLSFLPRFEDVYRLAPFEEITEETYKELSKIYEQIDFSKLPHYEQTSEEVSMSHIQKTIGFCE